MKPSKQLTFEDLRDAYMKSYAKKAYYVIVIGHTAVPELACELSELTGIDFTDNEDVEMAIVKFDLKKHAMDLAGKIFARFVDDGIKVCVWYKGEKVT